MKTTETYRKVKFKKWIPAVIYPGFRLPEKGTGCWENEFTNEGLFHQWASAYKESSAGYGNYTVALVELPTGEIESVLPSNLKFIDSE